MYGIYLIDVIEKWSMEVYMTLPDRLFHGSNLHHRGLVEFISTHQNLGLVACCELVGPLAYVWPPQLSAPQLSAQIDLHSSRSCAPFKHERRTWSVQCVQGADLAKAQSRCPANLP